LYYFNLKHLSWHANLCLCCLLILVNVFLFIANFIPKIQSCSIHIVCVVLCIVQLFNPLPVSVTHGERSSLYWTRQFPDFLNYSGGGGFISPKIFVRFFFFSYLVFTLPMIIYPILPSFCNIHYCNQCWVRSTCVTFI
jgi:hypothetical protein